MPYGTIKIDTITFTDGGVDKSVPVSGLVLNPTFTGNVTVTGTISGNIIQGGTTVSGLTVTGTTANFASGVFTTQVSGLLITGPTVSATTGTFTSLTGTTTTGTTANFASGVFTTQISGVTITGTTVSTTTGNFTSLTGTTATITSGIIASGTAALPSLAILSDPNTGIYSPGADQVAVATNGNGRLFVDGNGQVSVVSAATTTTNLTVNGAASFAASSNWNFPGLLLRRTASNIASAKQISFLLDGDNESDTTLTNYLNIWGTYSGTPTTSSTSTGLSASMNLGAPNAFIAHTNGSEHLRITSAGLVGIGTSAPVATLDVGGSTATTNGGLSNVNFYAGFAGSAFGGVLAGAGVTGNTPFIAASRNGAGTGLPLTFHTNGSERMRITSEGNVGIGTTSPGVPLEVNGTIYSKVSTSGDAAFGAFNSIASVFLLQQSDKAQIYTGAAQPIVFTNNNTERARIDSSGRLLVGTSTSTNTIGVESGLQVQGTGAGSFITSARWAASADNPGFIFAKSRGAAVNTRAVVSNNDVLGAVYFSGDDGTNFIQAALITAAVDGTPGANDMPGRLVFSTTADGAASPTEAMRISANGNVNVVGALSKGSGSFRIDHPLSEKKDTHHLIHSFIEGPQADLIYRGHVNLINGKAIINIDEAARMTEGTFNALCTNVCCFTSNESDWTAVRGSVSDNILTIEAQNPTSTAEVCWMVIGERKDQHMLDTNWTDENGRVITEPLKEVTSPVTQ